MPCSTLVVGFVANDGRLADRPFTMRFRSTPSMPIASVASMRVAFILVR
jgi:hypothetical protein